VKQSLASSLQHLGTDYVDSFVLHGPASDYGWGDPDIEVWEAMRAERDAGRTRLLGVSNVSLAHLLQMESSRAEMPAFVQNRCFALFGWDREVRKFCSERNIVYQGFSLLTANVQVLRHPRFISLARGLDATAAQVVFAFARAVGMLPLTGTSNPEHMRQDLESLQIAFPVEVVGAIESIAG
jgi:diketogulonate reductase-like aldo/keto reductase